MTRDVTGERVRLENEVAEAFIALQQTPEYQRWQSAESKLVEFMNPDEGGYALPDEFDDDDGTTDFTVNHEDIAE